MTRHFSSYLALGDSYTIGELVPLYESFPYQAVQLLRGEGLHFHAPEIVAKTGWTTSELAEHLLHTKLNEHYDFVSLLVGVNNQYRGLPIDDFKSDLEFLLKKALHFSGNKPERVIVISIPDWGVTPFAADREVKEIAREIDTYNSAKETLARAYNFTFIDITVGQRADSPDQSFLTSDKLHPSGREYEKWARLVSERIKSVLKS